MYSLSPASYARSRSLQIGQCISAPFRRSAGPTVAKMRLWFNKPPKIPIEVLCSQAIYEKDRHGRHRQHGLLRQHLLVGEHSTGTDADVDPGRSLDFAEVWGMSLLPNPSPLLCRREDPGPHRTGGRRERCPNPSRVGLSWHGASNRKGIAQGLASLRLISCTARGRPLRRRPQLASEGSP